MGLVFDEAPLQVLATVDVDQYGTRVLPEQVLQGRGIDDCRTLGLGRRRARTGVSGGCRERKELSQLRGCLLCN